MRTYDTAIVRSGVVTQQTKDGTVYVMLDNSNYSKAYHPKQCRHLKPKKKLREFWMFAHPGDNGKIDWSVYENPRCGLDDRFVHVREVREK